MRFGAWLVLAVGVGVAVVAAGCENDDARKVTVPHVTQRDVVGAYDELRDAGLRVAIRNLFSAASLCTPQTQKQEPAPGTVVEERTIVTITAGFCPLGSPAVTKTSARTPDFVGAPVTDVVAWADRHHLFWETRKLPPLPAGDRPHLLDNYRVTRQSPHPGTILRPGVMVRSQGARGFRPTPVLVSAALADG